MPSPSIDDYLIRGSKPSSSKTRKPLLEAHVTTLAPDAAPAAKSSDDKEERILDRISKCLDRGRHPTTPEAEARSSLLMASKLMKTHNIKESEVQARNGSREDNPHKSGSSVVQIIHTHGKKVILPIFVQGLGYVTAQFFDCKCYVHRTNSATFTKTELVFYGIGHNTSAAALAFEMLFNLVSHWALEKKGGSERHSYCMGIVQGLSELAEKERKANTMQVMVLDGAKSAEDYLREHDIRVRNPRKATSSIKDAGAFKVGKVDSTKINIRGKALKF